MDYHNGWDRPVNDSGGSGMNLYIRGTMEEVIAKLKELAEKENKGVNTNGK